MLPFVNESGEADTEYLAFNQQDVQLMYLAVDPAFDRLRGDPRYTDLVKRVRVPPGVPTTGH